MSLLANERAIQGDDAMRLASQEPTPPPTRGVPSATVDQSIRALAKADIQAANQTEGELRDGALPLNDFLRDLRREKRRADRSNAPLSLVLFEVGGSGDRAFAAVSQLVDRLRRITRETDSIGRVGDHVVAVLCPDTDEAGAKCLIDKVDAVIHNLPCAAVAATYPDELFDQLVRGDRDSSNVHALLISEQAATIPSGYPLKRALDVVGACIGILVFAPLMLLIALAVAVSSRGPILFRQQRVGKDGAPFTFYKFRSMFVDNDERVHQEFVKGLITENAASVASATADSGKPLYKMKRDPRITPVGRFIRKTSIDELPQLWNVLTGTMSLVGPRPPIPYETEHYQAWHARRVYSVKPGITGLWQVEGRSTVTFNEMVRIDLRYIRTCSLSLDLMILLKTVGVVLFCKGAD